jgi:polyisoprenoid-binding protein YceI
VEGFVQLPLATVACDAHASPTVKGDSAMSDSVIEPVRPGSPASIRPGRWTLDPARSAIRFTHKTIWGLVTVKGTFADLSGEGEVLPDRSAHGSLRIGAASLDTRNAKRDKHLRSADFFDVERHPEEDVTLTGEIQVDRKDFGLTWNQLGMIKDLTTLQLSAHFTWQRP